MCRDYSLGFKVSLHLVQCLGGASRGTVGGVAAAGMSNGSETSWQTLCKDLLKLQLSILLFWKS